MKIAAVVVTYNRKELLGECLAALLNQTRPLDEIIVIDNASTDGTEQLVKEKFSSVTYVKLPENTGGAGGFHEGMKQAYEKGYDGIWLMDDDATPLANSLQELLSGMEKLPSGEIGALLSTVVWSRDQCREKARDASLERVDSAMFVGWLAPRRALEVAGFPRKDFFIYWDDIEYSLRLRNKKLDLYRVPNSYVIHRDWTAQPTKSVNILHRRIGVPAYQDWKSYYLLRNRILTYKIQHSYPQLLKAVFWEIPAQVAIRVLVRDSGKIKYILKGTIDGFAGKTGCIVHPQAK